MAAIILDGILRIDKTSFGIYFFKCEDKMGQKNAEQKSSFEFQLKIMKNCHHLSNLPIWPIALLFTYFYLFITLINQISIFSCLSKE